MGIAMNRYARCEDEFILAGNFLGRLEDYRLIIEVKLLAMIILKAPVACESKQLYYLKDNRFRDKAIPGVNEDYLYHDDLTKTTHLFDWLFRRQRRPH